jgi:hypothetical protein
MINLIEFQSAYLRHLSNQDANIDLDISYYDEEKQKDIIDKDKNNIATSAKRKKINR